MILYPCPRQAAQGLLETLIGGGAGMTDLEDTRAMTRRLCSWTCWDGLHARTFHTDKTSLVRGPECEIWIKRTQIFPDEVIASTYDRDALYTTPDPFRPICGGKNHPSLPRHSPEDPPAKTRHPRQLSWFMRCQVTEIFPLRHSFIKDHRTPL